MPTGPWLRLSQEEGQEGRKISHRVDSRAHYVMRALSGRGEVVVGTVE